MYAADAVKLKNPIPMTRRRGGSMPSRFIAAAHWWWVSSPRGPSAAVATPSMSPGLGRRPPAAPATSNGPRANEAATAWASSCRSTSCGTSSITTYTSERHGFATFVREAPMMRPFSSALRKKNTAMRPPPGGARNASTRSSENAASSASSAISRVSAPAGKNRSSRPRSMRTGRARSRSLRPAACPSAGPDACRAIADVTSANAAAEAIRFARRCAARRRSDAGSNAAAARASTAATSTAVTARYVTSGARTSTSVSYRTPGK